MGKKKKKHKKHDDEIHVIQFIDSDIEDQYNQIRKDIEDYQYQIKYADRRTKKKFKKAMKKGTQFDYMHSSSILTRKKILKDMEEKDTMDNLAKMFNDFSPVITLIGRCVALLIVAILSFDSVKRDIKPETLEKMDMVYKIAMSV